MSILLIGLNHRSGPLDLLERLNLPTDAIPKAVDSLAKLDNIREAVLLSTCNRTEIYTVTEKFHGAHADVCEYLCQLSGLGLDELQPHLYAEHDESAVRHLFEVAAGLDSAVVGESEILGQVRSAWKVAQDEEATRSTLDLLFRHALQIGKRARTDTDIGRGTASVSHAAVEMAQEYRGDLSDASVAVVGAGAMGAGIAVALRAHGVGDVTVVTRNAERGRSLADRVDGAALGFEHLADALRDADVILTGTGSPTPVIGVELISKLDRAHRPLLIVDIAVPRDVEPQVGELDGVTVLNLDDLSAWADRGRARRLGEVADVRALVNEAVDHFIVDLSAIQAGPLIATLRASAEATRTAELERFRSELGSLDPSTQELVERITKGVVAKLMHTPSVRLRDQAGTPQGERNAAAVADLFDLG